MFAAFDQRQIAEFKEAFSFIDQNGDGYIDREDLRELLASMGQCPGDAELEMYLDGSSASSGVNFTLFLTMMGAHMQDVDPEAELLLAFEALDPHRTGQVSVDRLRESLTTMGDRLSLEEFDLLAVEMGLDPRGHLNYRDFVRLLASPQESLG